MLVLRIEELMIDLYRSHLFKKMGSNSDSNNSKGWERAQGLVLKTLPLIGGLFVVKRLINSTKHRDHARIVSQSLAGEKYSRDQASKDPDNYFNIRMLACPAAELVDGSKVLYFEEAFWGSPQKPFRQRFLKVKPCPKELKCDVQLRTYAIRGKEEYKNFCDRSKDQRPQPEDVIRDIAEPLAIINLKHCSHGKHCLYEGSTPPEGVPNSWNGATYCTSELAVMRNNEIELWNRGYDKDGNQIWGPKEGPYKFKPVPTSCFAEISSLDSPPLPTMERRMESSIILQE